MKDHEKKLVDTIFDSWNSGQTSDELAIQQLTRIVQATSDQDLLLEVNASLETIRANSGTAVTISQPQQ